MSHIKTRTSLTRFLARRYNGSVEAFLADLNTESDRLIRTDLKKAHLLTRRTAPLEKLLDDPHRTHLYRIWGRHFHLSGDFTQARRLYTKAINRFTRLGDYNSRAKVQKALLDVLMYLGRYDEAAKVGRRALRYFKSVNAKTDYAQVLTNIGNLYHRLSEHKKALKYYDRAYEIFKRLDNDYALALVQFNRGNIYRNLYDLDEAERLFTQAATIYRSLGMELAATQADYSLAYIAFLKSSYSESLNAFTVVADAFRSLGDRRCLALSRLDLAEVHLHLNLYSQAISDAMAVAEEFRALKISHERARAYYFAAVGYFAFGDYGMVSKLARRAMRIFEKENNRIWQVLCRFLLAKVDCREGRIGRAIETFREIAAFYRRRGDVRRYHDTRLAWLEALLTSRKDRAAVMLCRGIGKSLGELAGYQKIIYFTLDGDLNCRRDRPRLAIGSYRRAIEQAEKLQTTIFPDEIRRFFWMDKLAAHNRLASIYLDRGQKRRAFEVLEKGKAAMSRPSGESMRITSRKIPRQLMQEQIRLKAFLKKALLPPDSPSRAAIAAENIHTAEQRLWKIERTMRQKGYAESWTEAGLPCGLDDIQAKLGTDDALLHFVCRDEMFGVFVVDRHRFTFMPLDADPAEMRGLLARLYFMTNRTESRDDDKKVISDLIASLSAAIWRPLENRVASCRRLFIVPDGILSRLPFCILNDRNEIFLFERFEIYIFSSSSAFVRHDTETTLPVRDESMSILAVSDADMPGASTESMMVSRHFPHAHLFCGNEATAGNLFDGFGVEKSLVHIIAHAAQSYENDLFSPIMLSDGPVYPFDFITRPVRSELVVLSGCQTGDPGLYFSSDSLSIAQTLLAAGAKKAVASYWPVSDEITCLFMNSFYGHLAEGIGIFRALRAAMVDVRTRTADIRHWASFYLVCG